MLHNVSIRTNVTIVKAYALTVISISIIEAPSQKRLERCETDEPQIQKIRILFDYSITKWSNSIWKFVNTNKWILLNIVKFKVQKN